MPPKIRFTREELATAAFDLVREEGTDALTARALAKRVGCSVCPVFSAFKDMDEVRDAVREKADRLFSEYMIVADNYSPAYKKRGMQWIKFAQEEKNLFRMMFMASTGVHNDIALAVNTVRFGREDDIRIIMRDYHADAEQAEQMFEQMWIYTYGLCVLCATGMCDFSEAEAATKLGRMFGGTVAMLRSGAETPTHVRPQAVGTEEAERITHSHPDLRK